MERPFRTAVGARSFPDMTTTAVNPVLRTAAASPAVAAAHFRASLALYLSLIHI